MFAVAPATPRPSPRPTAVASDTRSRTLRPRTRGVDRGRRRRSVRLELVQEAPELTSSEPEGLSEAVDTEAQEARDRPLRLVLAHPGEQEDGLSRDTGLEEPIQAAERMGDVAGSHQATPCVVAVLPASSASTARQRASSHSVARVFVPVTRLSRRRSRPGRCLQGGPALAKRPHVQPLAARWSDQAGPDGGIAAPDGRPVLDSDKPQGRAPGGWGGPTRLQACSPF